MKVECVKESIQKAISKADKITGRNLSLPILSCILLSAKNNKLVIKSTNLDLGAEFTVPSKIVEEGEVAIPGHLISNYLSNVQGKNITLESKNGILTITAQKGKTTIKTLNHEDFPIIPKISNESTFLIETRQFIAWVKAVWYAASTSSIKPELSSVYIYFNDNFLYFVATDSFRLAEKKVSYKTKDIFQPLLIPYKNIPEIVRLIEDSEEINLLVTKNQIAFSTDDVYVTSRVVDGAFPDYKQIIPKSKVTEVVLLKEDIVNTLHLSTLFSDKFNQISFSIHPKNKIFEIKAKNNDVGDSVEKIDAALTGEDLDINFNYRYIVDSFQSIHTDSVALSFNGLQKPLVMRGVGDQNCLYLVMPMNR